MLVLCNKENQREDCLTIWATLEPKYFFKKFSLIGLFMTEKSYICGSN